MAQPQPIAISILFMFSALCVNEIGKEANTKVSASVVKMEKMVNEKQSRNQEATLDCNRAEIFQTKRELSAEETSSEQDTKALNSDWDTENEHILNTSFFQRFSMTLDITPSAYLPKAEYRHQKRLLTQYFAMHRLESNAFNETEQGEPNVTKKGSQQEPAWAQLEQLAQCAVRSWVAGRGRGGRCAAVVRSTSARGRLRVPELPVVALRVDDAWPRAEDDAGAWMRAALDAGCDAWVLQVRAPAAGLRALARAVPRARPRADGKMLLVLPAPAPPAEPKRLFREAEWELFPDALVAVFCPLGEGADERAEERALLGVAPRGRALCVSTHAWAGRRPWRTRALGRWEPSTPPLPPASCDELLPDKTRDLRGKLVTVGTFDYPPYTTFPGGGGFELGLLKHWLSSAGATCRLASDARWPFWGKALANGSSWGVRGLMAQGFADMGSAGFFHTTADLHFLAQAVPHMRNELVVLAPRPHPLGVLLAPARPFSPVLWSVTAAATAAAAAALQLLGTGASGPAALVAWGTLLGQSAPALPAHSRVARALLVALSELFALLAAAYAAGFAAELAVPRFSTPLDTVEQLARAGLRWSGTEDTWLFPLRGADSPALAAVVANFRTMPEEEMARLSHAGAFWGFISERLSDRSLLLSRGLAAERLRATQLPLGDTLVGFLARKGWPLLPALNRRVLRLLAAGLVSPAITREVRKRPNALREQAALRDAADPRVVALEAAVAAPHRLSLAHVSGALGLWAIGLAAAAVALAAEVALAALAARALATGGSGPEAAPAGR